MRHRAIPHNLSRFILIEPEVNKRPDEIPRLRTPLAHHVSNLPARGFGVPVSSFGACRKNEEISRVRRETDAKHERVFRRENQLIKQRRIEAVLQANLPRIRLAGKRRIRAIGPDPIELGTVEIGPLAPSMLSTSE